MAVTPRSKALMLNFPTNPTGGTMTREELMKIVEVVRRHELLVITDEIYSELTFEGEHVSIASLPGMLERTVFLHGFSKAYAMTGFRIGYACGPADIIETMMKIHQYSMLCASIISQEAAIEAILHGLPDTARMRDEYRLRRNFIVKAYNDMGLACHLPRGSFYAFPNIQSSGLSWYPTTRSRMRRACCAFTRFISIARGWSKAFRTASFVISLNSTRRIFGP